MKVKIRQIVSAIGTTDVQKANLRSLKLGRIGKSSVFDSSDKAFAGRLAVIKHLVSVEELTSEGGLNHMADVSTFAKASLSGKQLTSKGSLSHMADVSTLAKASLSGKQLTSEGSFSGKGYKGK